MTQMNPNTPLSPQPLQRMADARRRVMSLHELREHGISPAMAEERCRPGGPWQLLLPGVLLLRRGEATGAELLEAVLRYAGGRTGGEGNGQVMITGLAGLALHGFPCVSSLAVLNRLDVLVPRSHRLRSTGLVRIVRSHTLPCPVDRQGVPVAPVSRALADAVTQLSDADAVRQLLVETVRAGHCEPQAVIREFSRARLLNRPHVVSAVKALLAESRAMAEERLLEVVRYGDLPDPCWNVELRLPDGLRLGEVDAYWPEHAVAVEIDARLPRQDTDAVWCEHLHRRETLEQLGISVVHITPQKLRESPEQQATVVRTALLAATEACRVPRVVVLPR